MPTYELIIKGGKIVFGGSLIDSDICISEGKISTLERQSTGQSTRVMNANGLLIFPGLIDPHVHFRDPGFTQKEDFESGTKGAAAGGSTTIFDMPNTSPVVTTAQIFNDKKNIVKPEALVNFGLFAAASHENLPEIRELARSGAVAFKTYMISPPKEREKEYAGSFITTSGQLYKTISEVKQTGLVHCVHAESDSTIATLTEQIRAEGRKDPMAHYDSRPNFTEAEAVCESLILAEVLKAKLHLVHLSTAESADLVSVAKKRGVDVTAETCPQYLCFTKEILTERGPDAKFNPPARNENDVKEMTTAINSGLIDMVSTDHAPHLKDEKMVGREDIFKAPSGTPGVETRLPILLNMVHEERLSLSDIPRITSEAAAKRFGLFPRKGAIRIGSDADLTLVDYKQSWKIKASELQTKAWETVLFDGISVTGKVKFTIVNGNVAFEEGAGFAKTGEGQFVSPQFVI